MNIFGPLRDAEADGTMETLVTISGLGVKNWTRNLQDTKEMF
jgi:hypothetical protein